MADWFWCLGQSTSQRGPLVGGNLDSMGGQRNFWDSAVWAPEVPLVPHAFSCTPFCRERTPSARAENLKAHNTGVSLLATVRQDT